MLSYPLISPWAISADLDALSNEKSLILFSKYDGLNNSFIGRNATEYREDSVINTILEKGIISQDECDKYYVLDEMILNENGLGDAIVKDNEYILVNYESEEIVLSRPYIYKKHEYYKLSDIKQIER